MGSRQAWVERELQVGMGERDEQQPKQPKMRKRAWIHLETISVCCCTLPFTLKTTCTSLLTKTNFCFICTQGNITWQPAHGKETLHSSQGL